jgi:hypothetical protein
MSLLAGQSVTFYEYLVESFFIGTFADIYQHQGR